jgi:iron complex outermembrane receptor protein
VDAEPEWQNTYTLQGDGYVGNENLETGGAAQTAGGNLLGRWTHTFSGDSDMQLQVYYDRTHLRNDAPALVTPGGTVLAPSGVFADDLDTYDIDFQHHFHLAGRNNIVWGLGYRFTHEVEQNAPSLAFLPAVQDLNLYSGFLQDEIRLRPDWYFTLGSKLEHNDYTGFEWEPSARLRWDVTASQMLWAAVSRAVRTPSRIDRALSEGEPPYFVLLAGNPDFESEKLIAYELGYRAQLGPKLSTSISTFYNQYDDIRSTSVNPATIFPLFFQNNVQGETYGIEFSAAYQLFAWWRLRGGYDYLHEHLYVTPGQTDFNNALNETADPKHQFSLRSSMDLLKNTELDAGLRWVDTLHNNNGPNVGTVPSYFELDVKLAWHPTKRLELSVAGQNLLHDQHPEYGYPDPARVEIKRSIYGKVAWQF